MRTFAVLVAGVFCLPANQSGGQETNAALTVEQLREQVETHLAQPKFSSAIWGVKIVSLDTGKTLFEHHADRLMSPASNSKLYTAALALDQLGGDYRISTPVYATGKINGSGALHGDVVVAGRGDPSWNSRRLGTNFWAIFEPFVAVITNAGVRQIKGNVIADATLFKGQPMGSGWTIDDLRYGETGGISALSLDDNLAQISVSPGATPGSPCRLLPLQPGTGLMLSNQTVTVASNVPAHFETFHPLEGGVTYVLGQMALGATNEILDVAVPQPADWFAASLKLALRRRGVKVSGRARGIAWPQKAEWSQTKTVLLGAVRSPPLAEIIRNFMKPSQNLETDLLLAHVGELARGSNAAPRTTSEELGLEAMSRFLATAGVSPGDVRFDEGSGLSRNNLTTANATVALLQFMASHREAENFIASLPVAGVDGTLRRRFWGTPAAGNVRAKTGTLRWAHALSGYVTSAAGERLAFSIMLNRYAATPGHNVREELDALALMLARFGGRSEGALEKMYAPLGKLIITQFASAPFPHPARSGGHRYQDEFFSAEEHYSDDTVALFIPKSFRSTGKVDCVVHFHGWRNTVAGALEQYKLIEQFASSGKNAILIVPQGPRLSADSFGGRLEDTNGFQAFMTEAKEKLSASGALAETNFDIGRVILSGHSGGYHVMAAILDHGGLSDRIREVWLFDALYGGAQSFASWQSSQKGRLLNIYTDHGGTKGETEDLMASLKSSGVSLFASEDASSPQEALCTNSLVFLHTDMSHNEVLAKRGTFGQFLQTSCLDDQ
jgi:D-alanyl-D-alanine carboxypeptidase/D-alanyl-D-alanine-endopeptidase (penicillin-binding protein 4)